MEYPNLVERKKRVIKSFMDIYNQYWADKDSIPYSQSLYALSNVVRGIDYAYETGFEVEFGHKPTKIRHYPSMIELVEALHSLDVSPSEIRMILGYEEEEVRRMVKLLELHGGGRSG